MARRAYYARIRSQPSLRSCCSRVSVRETFSLTGVTCFLPMSYLSHLFAPATAHRFAAWRPFSFRLTIVGAHTQSPARERLRKKQRLPCDFPERTVSEGEAACGEVSSDPPPRAAGMCPLCVRRSPPCASRLARSRTTVHATALICRDRLGIARQHIAYHVSALGNTISATLQRACDAQRVNHRSVVGTLQ